MKVLNIGCGDGLSTVISGGGKKTIEVTKRLIKKGVIFSFLSSPGGISILEREKVIANYFCVRASLFSKREKFKFGRAFSYLLSTIHAYFLISKLPLFDIVISSSDYFCDVIPAYYYKKRYPQAKWVAISYHRLKSSKERVGNFLLNLLSYLQQQLSFYLISKKADRVFLLLTQEGDEIKQILVSKGLRAEKIKTVDLGINYKFIISIPQQPQKEYDAVFLGGLRASKGIYDLLTIWHKVCSFKPDARLVVVGGAAPDIISDFKKRIAEAKLTKNISVLGFVENTAKVYQIMKSSRIYISPSYEEGWGIAIGEALACGLPVVAYDLPAYRRIYGSVINTVPVGDKKAFAEKVISLLSLSDQEREKMAPILIQSVAKYDWDEIAEKEYQYLLELLKEDKN